MKIYKSVLKAAVIIATVFLVSPEGAVAQQNIVHSKGETRVMKNPQRVIILDLGSLETYSELGIPVIGGPDKLPDYLPQFTANNPGYTGVGSVARANIAKIAELKPDLIIIGGRLGGVYDSLSAIAPTILFGADNNDFWSGFEKNVNTIASLHGKEKAAGKKLATIRQKVEKVREKSKADQGKALFVLHVNNRFAPSGPKSRFSFGYDVLGLQPAYTPEPAPERGRSEEQARLQSPSLTQINPDYLFIIDRETGIKGTMPDKEALMTDDVKATKAFKNGRVFLLPGNIWYLSGGGLISVEKQITDVGRQLYGLSL